MFWKKRDTEDSGPAEARPGTFGPAIRAMSNSLRELILLPKDPASRNFAAEVNKFEHDALQNAEDPERLERQSKRVADLAKEFGGRQRDSVDKTLAELDFGIRSVTQSIGICSKAGSDLETAGRSACTRLDRLQSAPSLEAIREGIRAEVSQLQHAIQTHAKQLDSVKREYSRELEELQSRLLDAQQMARKDHLTQLGNRTFADEELAKAILAATKGEGYALALLDLDGFKYVNDTFGHAAGDRVLSEFAQRLVKILGKAASIARTGGDEFVVISRGSADHLEARMVILTQGLEMDPIMDSGIRMPVGSSYGVVSIKPTDTAERVLAIADQNMYALKNLKKSSRKAA